MEGKKIPSQSSISRYEDLHSFILNLLIFLGHKLNKI